MIHGESIHSVAIVLVAELSEHLDATIGMPHDNGWMRDAIEGVSLDRGVVQHVLEHDVIAHLQGASEAPRTQVVATQATVATQAIDVLVGAGYALQRLGSTHGGPIGHLQTVGHVAGKRDIEDGGTDAVIGHDVHDARNQRPCLPPERRTGFEDDAEPRIPLVQAFEQGYEVFDVIVTTGHQMATAQVEPLDLLEPSAKLSLQMH